MPAQKGKLPVEKTRLALVCDSNLRDLRGVIEGLIKAVNSEAKTTFTPADAAWAQVGAQIIINGNVAGFAGLVSQTVKEKFDFGSLIPCCAELEFELLLTLHSKTVKLKPIPKYPSIKRDLSIVINDNVRWADIADAVSKKASAELENVQFIEIYRGKNIPAGKKSITLSLHFRDEDGTLTHERVDSLEADIVSSLNTSAGAELRTV